MNRVKFLVFALVTVGLWAYHLVAAGAPVVKVVDQASGAVVGAGAAVALRIEAQRSEAEAALVQLASNPASRNLPPRGAAKDGAGVERFNAVRQVLQGVVSEGNKPVLAVAVVTEQGGLFVLGAGDPGPIPAGFDTSQVTQAEAAGSIVILGEVPYVFFATPLSLVDHNEVRVGGQALAGLPLLPDAKRLEAVAKELKLSTLAVASGGKVLLAAGPEKVQAEPALKSLKAGQVTAMSNGPVRQLGPIGLPLFVDAPRAVGSRQVLAGTPFEVLALASLREPWEALAAYQLFGILGLLGMLLLAGVVGWLIRAEDEGGTRMSLPPPLPMPPSRKEEPQPVALMGAPSRGPEGSPDDFHFPPSAVSAVRAKDVLASIPTPSAPQPMPAMPEGPPVLGVGSIGSPPGGAPENRAPLWSPPVAGPAPDQDPFASAGPVSLPPIRMPSPAPLSTFAMPPTASIPASSVGELGGGFPSFEPGGDPFAGAGPLGAPPAGLADDSVDTTRVAAVPQELLRASRAEYSSGLSGERPAPPRASAEGPPRVQSVALPLDPEEKHYQEVFRDFVSTRERCGEPADGLTYERFKAKLLKNRDQLMSKYQCRAVRFQVYVKEGKAALKATPVKD